MRLHAAVRRKFRRDVRSSSFSEGVAMEKVLLPIDGSKNALAAVRQVAEEYRRNPIYEVYLLNVQPRFSRHVAQFVSRKNLDDYRTEQAKSASQSAKDLLDRFNVPYKAFVDVGPKAEVIAEFAKRHGCSRIVVGTARKNSLTRLLQHSVTAKLLEQAHVPVELVVGNDASRWERFGIPVGVGAAMAAVFVAAD
ncbi:MAG: universal stress protein [Burkholderiales bacterium]